MVFGNELLVFLLQLRACVCHKVAPGGRQFLIVIGDDPAVIDAVAREGRYIGQVSTPQQTVARQVYPELIRLGLPANAESVW